MYKYDSLYLLAAVGSIFVIGSFFQHRFWRPDRPLKVPRLLALLAGSRTIYVDCIAFAIQIAAVSLPVWDFCLNLRSDIELRGNPFVYDPVLVATGTGFLVYFLCTFIARRRLKSAEYVMLGGQFALPAEGDCLAGCETVCQYCGYQAPVWNFRAMRLEGELKRPSIGYACSKRGDCTFVVPSEIAKALGNAMVSGCALQPVGGSEPAKWYGLSSDHILPAAVATLGGLRNMPYRTPKCEENHGFEIGAARKDWESYYRRSTFHALDVSASYELIGGKRRRGGRLLIVSKKVFRLLIGFDKNFLWLCQPVLFVD